MDGGTLLADVRLMPVVVIEEVAAAIPLADALAAAGIRAIEITLRTDAGLPSIAAVARARPELLVGAGSVISAEQLRQVQDAGARFAVSPGHTEALLAAAGEFPYLPGAATATECMRLLEYGYRLQKFFPTELSGGVAAISALSAPLPEIRFCVTGGITPKNLAAYLACPAVACVGGSWFVPSDLLGAGEYATIEQLAAHAVALTEAQEPGRHSSPRRTNRPGAGKPTAC